MNARRWKKIGLWGLGCITLVLIVLLVVVRLTLGGGEPYPNVSTPPRVPHERVDVLVELDWPAGNVTSSASGRIFFNLHPFAEPWRFTDGYVFELVDGKPRPFPDQAFQERLKGVLGMTVDAQDRLWLVAPAGLEDRPTRLFGFDLASNRLLVDHAIDKSVGMFLQDLRVSIDGKTIYLADTGAFFLADPAIVVFDIEKRSARRVLQGHPSVEPQNWEIRTRHGPYKLAWGLVTFAAGVDGLAVSRDGKWLYYATMNHDQLFRIETRHLADASQSSKALASHVQAVGTKPLSDGIEIDDDNNVFITDVENGGLAVLSADGKLSTVTADASVVWSDAVNIMRDGSLLFTDSRIPAYIDPLLRPPARKKLEQAGPHRIFRVRAQDLD